MYEGLSPSEIEVIDAIKSEWLMVRRRINRRRVILEKFKKTGIGFYPAPVKVVGYDIHIQRYAKVLNLEYHKTTRHFTIRNIPVKNLKKLLKSARRVLSKYECCSFTAKSRVKCTQFGEREQPYIVLPQIQRKRKTKSS